MVEHRSLAAMAAAHERVLHHGSTVVARRVAQNAASTFDVFFADMVNLASGRTLYVVDEATRRDPERLARFITGNGIHVLNGTPTQIRAVLAADQVAALSSLQILILSGEAIDAELWRRLRRLRGVRVYNFYGPTECTVHVTAAAVAEHEAPVIGQALPECRAWVVDTALQPVPDGTSGEICISGSQVARGYLNPGQSDQGRFVEIRPPLSSVPVRAYRTGDRGRRNKAGQLEFLGRVDDQVSIAGYRIELGEVETTLRACPGVRDAAVGLRGSGPDTVLTAWAVLATGTSVEDLRNWATSMLPRYMMPRLNAVPMIPMSRSGKADVATLLESAAEPDLGSMAGEPVGDRLRGIWCAVLGVSSVGQSDDFFALGGDSLKATNMTMAARAALMPELPIRVIFDHPRFDAFSGVVSDMLAKEC
jgi:acyl-coenzyme A synthetase/AMP-(fatty) acid ligase